MSITIFILTLMSAASVIIVIRGITHFEIATLIFGYIVGACAVGMWLAFILVKFIG